MRRNTYNLLVGKVDTLVFEISRRKTGVAADIRQMTEETQAKAEKPWPNV